jgi:hypothetical protein
LQAYLETIIIGHGKNEPKTFVPEQICSQSYVKGFNPSSVQGERTHDDESKKIFAKPPAWELAWVCRRQQRFP